MAREFRRTLSLRSFRPTVAATSIEQEDSDAGEHKVKGGKWGRKEGVNERESAAEEGKTERGRKPNGEGMEADGKGKGNLPLENTRMSGWQEGEMIGLELRRIGLSTNNGLNSNLK